MLVRQEQCVHNSSGLEGRLKSAVYLINNIAEVLSKQTNSIKGWFLDNNVNLTPENADMLISSMEELKESVRPLEGNITGVIEKCNELLSDLGYIHTPENGGQENNDDNFNSNIAAGFTTQNRGSATNVALPSVSVSNDFKIDPETGKMNTHFNVNLDYSKQAVEDEEYEEEEVEEVEEDEDDGWGEDYEYDEEEKTYEYEEEVDGEDKENSDRRCGAVRPELETQPEFPRQREFTIDSKGNIHFNPNNY